MKRWITVLFCCLWLLTVAVCRTLSGGILIEQVPQFMLVSNNIESGSKFIGLDSYEDTLYGLLALKTAEDKPQTYRIVEISEDGQALTATPVFALVLEEESTVSDFACVSDGFYVSVITTAGNSAGIYFVETDYLSEDNLPGSEEEPDFFSLHVSQTLTAEEGRQINWAGYEDGAFVSWKDDGTGVVYYIEDVTGDAAGEQLLMDAGQEASNQQFYLITWLVLLFAGFGLIILAVNGLYRRSYTVYMVAITEALLFLLILACAVLTIWMRRTTVLEEDEQFSQYYLELFADNIDDDEFQNMEADSFYSEDDYYTLWDKLADFVADERTEGNFSDLCLVRSEDQMVLVSASGKNGLSLENIYGGEEFLEVELQMHEGFCLTAVLSEEEEGWFADTFTRRYLLVSAVLFLLSSAVCLAFLLSQGREISGLSRAMLTASGGYEVPSKERARSKDVALMWNSFMEMQKKINQINYARYRIYESCYRFAPKDIEKIFGRDSITEVDGGDFVRLMGTMAFVTSDEPESPDEDSAARMSSFVTLVEKHQEESGGFFVPGNSDLTSLRVLFLEDNHHSVDFGTSFLNEFSSAPELNGMKTGILLHYSEFLYAVAGNDQQCFPFLLSEDKEQMERFAAWFREMGLKLVITDEVRIREKIGVNCRYIGYIFLEKAGKKVELYEALNACAPVERRLKLESEEKFQRAIRLFYQHDFYLARNGFSDVLKINPYDQISKWYLFTCEKYLNQTYSAGDICRLRPEA
ncbi:MAG: hypothetical protein LUH58_07345 [Lachnospiraceae bacterium]|nr:hypothetical protein [Lachnospiraceae bacterium]